MKTRRDILTPAIVIGGVVLVILFLWAVVANGQTHTFPGNNVFPSTSTTDFNAGSSVDFTGATVTGLSVSGALQWDGGATNLVAATGRTSLGLVIGANVEAWDTDLDVWATKTPYAGTVTVTTGKTFNCTGNLTLAGTDGSTLNMGSGGTLGTAAYTASTAYQAADTDLTTWAGITPVTAVGTWIAAPSSANLRLAMTDENGTGALLFNGATTPDFTTGFTIGAAAASGKILIGNGTNYVPSTPTWPTAAGTAGYTIRSDGTNFTSYPQDMFNSSVTSQSPTTSDVYLTNSNVTVAAGDFKAKGQYRCIFDMTKSAGTGAIVISLRVGTAGAIGDPAILTFTFTAGTSVADAGTFEIIATWRTVGSGTSAVMQGVCRAHKNTATAAGLWGLAADSQTIVATTSSGFNSSTATSVGVSFNGSTAFAGTTTLVQSTLIQ